MLPVLSRGSNEIILHLSLLKKVPSCIKNELHYGEVHPANILIPHPATVGGHLFWEDSEMQSPDWSVIHLRLGEGPADAWGTFGPVHMAERKS